MRTTVSGRGAAALAVLALASLTVAAGSEGPPARSVAVVVQARGGAPPTDAVRAAGGAVDATYGRLASARVPVASLAALRGDPRVASVRAPLRPVPDGVGEGIAAVQAPGWHAAGYRGAGVKVAVIDSNFKDASFFFVDKGRCETLGTSSHGTAVATIVHEMAPDAEIRGYCAGNEVQLGDAARTAVREGAKVVVESLSWFNGGPGNGSGSENSPVDVANKAVGNGAVWVNSAGNFAQRHWSGRFTDGDGDGWSEFGPGDEGNSLAVPAHTQLCAYLKWNDWPVSSLNFNLFLYRQFSGNGSADQLAAGTTDTSVTPRAGSTNQQAGGEPPTEQLCYTNTGAAAEAAFLAVQRVAGTDAGQRFDLFVTTADLQYEVAAGSVAEPATSPSVIAVGAACWQTNGLEPYSSRGPTIDGVVKPDLTGPDSVSSVPEFGGFTGCGTSGFRGTSAAAPHVAGAAALVRGRYPSWSPAQVRAYLEQNALDLGARGKDDDSGAGMLRLPAIPPPPPPAPPPAPPPPRLRVLDFETVPGRSVAGATLRARAVVAVVGADATLTSGKVACAARVGKTRLRPRLSRFQRGFASCVWAVPRSGAGKLLRGSLRVVYERGSVGRSFQQRVRRPPRKTRG